MKKFILMILPFVFLSSCSPSGGSYAEIKQLLSSPVRIDAVLERETEIEFKLFFFADESVYTFLSPESLNYLTLVKNEKGCVAKYDGIETEIDENSMLGVLALERAVFIIRVSGDSRYDDKNGSRIYYYSIDSDNVLVYYNVSESRIEKITSEINGQSFNYKINGAEKITV